MKSLVLSFAFLLCCFNPVLAEGLFKDFKAVNKFKVRGETFFYPIHVYEAKQVSLAFSVSKENMPKLNVPKGFEIVTVAGESLGILQGIHNESSNFQNGFQETAYGFILQKKGDKTFKGLSISRLLKDTEKLKKLITRPTVLYVDSFADNEYVLDFELPHFGILKTKGSTKFVWPNLSRKELKGEFKLFSSAKNSRSLKDNLVFSARFRVPKVLKLKVSLSKRELNPFDQKGRMGRVVVDGDAYLFGHNILTDSIVYSMQNTLGIQLWRMKLRPLYWAYFPNYKMVMTQK